MKRKAIVFQIEHIQYEYPHSEDRLFFLTEYTSRLSYKFGSEDPNDALILDYDVAERFVEGVNAIMPLAKDKITMRELKGWNNE